MSKYLFPLMIGLLLVALTACGTAAQPGAPQGSGAQPAEPTQAAQPKESGPTSMPQVGDLEAYAAAHAGGPGAIYVGRLEDLVGPAPAKDLGNADGNVPLDSLERHKWIYDSEYYRKMLEKARLDNPTPLTTTGRKFQVQYACINQTLLPCKLMSAYFAPSVLERTQGQVEVQVVGYPELGIAGPDTLQLVDEGTLGMSEIYGGYVSGDLPVMELFYFWGLYPDHESEFKVEMQILPDVDKFVSEGAGGAVTLTHNWYAGNDQYLFSRDPLRTLEDYKGIKVRSHGTTLSDFIIGMGGEAQFVAFAEVYPALERGILDAAVTGATAGYGLRFYEVAKYLVGPFRSFPATFIIFNKRTWEQFPPDIQQILLEEGAKYELEALRVSAIQNEEGLPKNVEAGMEHIPFSPEINDHAFSEAIMNRMIPNWVQRVGGADKPEVLLFNEKVAPVAGVRIDPDGTAVKIEGHPRWAAD